MLTHWRVDIYIHDAITMIKMINISIIPKSFLSLFVIIPSTSSMSHIPLLGNHWSGFCLYRFYFFTFFRKVNKFHKWNHRVCTVQTVCMYNMYDFYVFSPLIELLCNLFMSWFVSIIHSFSLRNNISLYQ